MPDLAQRVAARWKNSGLEKLPLSVGERRDYQDVVWAMYAESYRSIGLQAKTPSDLMEFDVWDLLLDEGTPVAFSLAKKTRFGIKGGLLGSDGSPSGKGAIKSWIKARMNLPGYYVEVSHAVERLSEGAPVVCAVYVPEVLGKPVKPMPDGIHYERVLTGIGTVVKKMVGSPRGIPSGDGQACPTNNEARTATLGEEDSDVVSILSHHGCQYDLG